MTACETRIDGRYTVGQKAETLGPADADSRVRASLSAVW